MGLIEELERRMRQLQRDQEIHCPHCDAVYVDEERDCVTYWGEGPDREVECRDCDRPR
jgi:hypothetical protein